MAGNKYVSVTTGGLKQEVAANDVSAGAGDAAKIIALDSTGRIDNSMMPVGIGADTATIVASEALAAGDFVNIWDNATVVSVRKADASSASAGKTADGFVLAAVSNAANATVYFEGSNTQLTGLTKGARYFLSGTTAGAVTTTAPTTSGHTVQYLGKAYSTTAITFEMGEPIIRA